MSIFDYKPVAFDRGFAYHVPMSTATASKKVDLQAQADAFKALSEPTRLRILQLLPPTPSCQEVYNVSELSEELGVPQPTVSHHLKILFQAGVIKSEKMCRDVYYWVDKKAVEETMKEFKELIRQK